MTKHRAEYRLLKYPFRIYLYYWMNKWYYFTKPKIKAKIGETINAITRTSLYRNWANTFNKH